MKCFKGVLLFAALMCLAPVDASAKNGGKSPQKPKTEQKFRTVLLVNPEFPELQSANARVDFSSKKKVVSLKSRLLIPSSSSLGIVDAATATVADIHIEWTREGQIVADCSLKFDASDESMDDSPAKFQFRLHIKNNGKQDVKGTCGPVVPSLLKTDSVKVYKLSNATERLDFLYAP